MAAKTLAPALSGSCALLSFFDSKTDTMKVACTGDSRAILGRKTASGKWTALPLSIDQTGSNPEEAARVRREHPGEPGVIHAGRVLGGLEPSRAFGDAIYKWSPDVQRRLRSNFFTRNPHRSLQTPPYVTAEPVVTTTKIQPGNGDFVVMATDGLWEMLTNEEVVGLVGWWLDEEHSRNLSQSKSSNGTSILSPGGGSSWLRRLLSKPLRDLPIEKSTPSSSSDEADASGESKAGQKRPIRQQQWDLDTKSPDLNRFVCEDRNVATHLVRNALGGKNGDTVAALLTLSSPHSRRYRDDLTVNVVFFGDEGEDASDSPDRIIRNKDASVGQDGQRTGLSEDLKAKL